MNETEKEVESLMLSFIIKIIATTAAGCPIYTAFKKGKCGVRRSKWRHLVIAISWQ